MRTQSANMLGHQENQENALWRTAKECNTTKYCLPPNVSGSMQGSLDFSLDRVQWNVSNYGSITARVVWWGEGYDEAASIRIGSSSPNCINYTVCTNYRLFRKYLSTCETIEVRFISQKGTGPERHIGAAFITLPNALLGPGNDLQAPVVYTNTVKIRSSTNAIVGMLKMTIKMVIFEDVAKSGDPLKQRKDMNTTQSAKSYLTYRKDPFIQRPESAASNLSSSSKVWSFLRGKEMSPRDEEMTLRELTEVSPANSVIEAMDEELTWKLRDFYSKSSFRDKVNKCHNPGSAEKEGEYSKKDHNGTPADTTSNANNQSNGRGGENISANERNVEFKTEKREAEDSGATEEYQGVLYIGGFRNHHPHNRVPNVFCIAKSISNVDEALLKTHLSDPNLFINYLKLFPICIEGGHLDAAMKQNSLAIELWTRHSADSSGCGQDVKMGSACVALHPFYVAFRSEIVRQRLFDLSMPVIAVDGWTMVQGQDGASIGQLEVCLAMGTRRQVEYFVLTKELLNRRMETTPPVSARSTETATSILSSFLENLSQQMAANKARQDEGPAPKRGEMRKTSDLLDVLQRSMNTPPSTNGGRRPTIAAAVTAEDVPDSSGEFLKISLEIESAMHLPLIAKLGGGGGGDSSAKKKSGAGDEEPSAYATFEARWTDAIKEQLVDSVEGKVFATRVVERSSSPVWNQQFTVEIPKDLLTHPEKYFIVKIWRKANVAGDLLPTPLSDVVIGFCTVDLKVLTAGLPEITGSYNIVYFDGKCNGQLQLKLKPLQEIQHRDVLDTDTEQVPMPMLDLSLGADLSLSRTLKRKFTELDEITQRLRARLHDVTSSELISSDDEFENYLNTSVDEVDVQDAEVEAAAKEEERESGDVVDAVKDDFNWLGNLTTMQRQFVEIDRQLQRSSQTLNELLDRSAMPGTSAQSANLYTNGGGSAATVESLETALKDAVLNERPSST